MTSHLLADSILASRRAWMSSIFSKSSEEPDLQEEDPCEETFVDKADVQIGPFSFPNVSFYIKNINKRASKSACQTTAFPKHPPSIHHLSRLSTEPPLSAASNKSLSSGNQSEASKRNELNTIAIQKNSAPSSVTTPIVSDTSITDNSASGQIHKTSKKDVSLPETIIKTETIARNITALPQMNPFKPLGSVYPNQYFNPQMNPYQYPMYGFPNSQPIFSRIPAPFPSLAAQTSLPIKEIDQSAIIPKAAMNSSALPKINETTIQKNSATSQGSSNTVNRPPPFTAENTTLRPQLMNQHYEFSNLTNRSSADQPGAVTNPGKSQPVIQPESFIDTTSLQNQKTASTPQISPNNSIPLHNHPFPANPSAHFYAYAPNGMFPVHYSQLHAFNSSYGYGHPHHQLPAPQQYYYQSQYTPISSANKKDPIRSNRVSSTEKSLRIKPTKKLQLLIEFPEVPGRKGYFPDECLIQVTGNGPTFELTCIFYLPDIIRRQRSRPQQGTVMKLLNVSTKLKDTITDITKNTLTWSDIEMKLEKMPPAKRVVLDYDKLYTMEEVEQIVHPGKSSRVYIPLKKRGKKEKTNRAQDTVQKTQIADNHGVDPSNQVEQDIVDVDSDESDAAMNRIVVDQLLDE